MLADAEVHALHQRGIDVPAQRTEHLIDGLHRAKDHAVFDLDQASPPRHLDHLGIEQLRQRHPARLRSGAFGLPTLRLHPLPIVREQGARQPFV